VSALVLVVLPAQAALPSVPIKGFDTTTLTIALGKTWRDDVRVGTTKGRTVFVQRSSTSTGPWTTVGRLLTGSQGNLTVSIKPTRAGTSFWRLLTPKTTRTAATASRAKRIIAKQTYPLYVAGAVSGTYQAPSSAWRLTWQGTITFVHEPLDPFFGMPWTDGKLHYKFFSGSYNWVVEDLGGSCQESGSGRLELVPGANSAGDMTITRKKTTQGWKWEAFAALFASATTNRMPVEVVCTPPDPEDPVTRFTDDYSRFVAVGSGAIVDTNASYTTSLRTFAATYTITNPMIPGYEQRWEQNLQGSVFDLI
jgi:hypothetical protein